MSGSYLAKKQEPSILKFSVLISQLRAQCDNIMQLLSSRLVCKFHLRIQHAKLTFCNYFKMIVASKKVAGRILRAWLCRGYFRSALLIGEKLASLVISAVFVPFTVFWHLVDKGDKLVFSVFKLLRPFTNLLQPKRNFLSQTQRLGTCIGKSMELKKNTELPWRPIMRGWTRHHRATIR